jgi:ribonuclease VapC
VIIDSSALVAVFREEPDADRFKIAIATADKRRISAANFVETAIVVDRLHDPLASKRLDDFLARTQIEIAPVTERQARIAREAYRNFGKGSGHPAQLNYGDCFAYALATELAEPLLFKGDDFTKAGIDAA